MKEHEAVLPTPSVATQVITVVSFWKIAFVKLTNDPVVEPVNVATKLATEQLSVAVALNNGFKFSNEHKPLSVLTFTVPKVLHVINGFTES